MSVVALINKIVKRLSHSNELAAKGAKVIVTTTTHIRPPKPPFVKGALSLPRKTGAASSQDIDRLLAEIRDALGSASPLGLTGGPVNGKSGPVDKALVRRLPEIADFIIAEADGSRGLPIKAPATHEPVIPPASALVVAVAGLSALGRPLDEVCHRPELAAALLSGDETTFRLFRTQAPELVHLPDATYEWYCKNYLDRYYPVRFILHHQGIEFPQA